MEPQDSPLFKEIYEAWEKRGVRARDWSLEDLSALVGLTPTDHWMEGYIRMMYYYALLDRRRFAPAHLQITLAHQAIVRWNWNDLIYLIKLEYAFILAMTRDDLLRAQWLVDDVPDTLTEWAPLRHRAQAAILQARGKTERAREAADESRRLRLAESPDVRPNIQAELDWLDWIFEPG